MANALGNVIDFKFAQVFVSDGYGHVGAVNNASGYATSATTMLVDGWGTGIALVTGDTFQLTGDDTIYTITAHTETSGITSSITFTPGLVVAATDNEVITVLPHILEVVIGEGNFSFTRKTPREYKKNRGLLDAVRNADQEPMDVSFDSIWEFYKSNTSEPVTITEALYQEGAAASWITVGHPCAPFAVNVKVVYTPPCSAAKAETIFFDEFRPDTQDGALRDGTFAFKGQCNRVAPHSSRAA